MKKKHINIPIFIPELACPFQCIYCNQRKISGQLAIPDKQAIIQTIETYLQSVKGSETEVQLAYFGGNFTAIKREEQEDYLQIAEPYIHSGRISGIRISTRPDYINEEILKLLKRYHVKAIELGAQSMDEEVLLASKRGHTAVNTVQASEMIKTFGFSLGLQMMIGLPSDTLEKAIFTAQQIIGLKAENTRIYPTLVIKGTHLEKLYERGEYDPLTQAEAVKWAASLYELFEAAGVRVLKLGLHPSEGLTSGKDLRAGPFHPSFRELVYTTLWKNSLQPLLNQQGSNLILWVAPGQVNHAVGYSGSNKKKLLNNFGRVAFKTELQLTDRNFRFEITEKSEYL
ncbi:MAG: radical SAM protein [Bacteroidales bacterium]|nr:radical SAM protein [Bacteroidales bacterium]MCF8403277.1 radical SAM protein [Bacteroidales bacterium]